MPCIVERLMNIEEQPFSEICRRLVDAYHPKRLILFGSRVWGTPDQDSDLDIMVEVDETDEPVWKRPRKGYKALFGIGFPCDILVRTSDEIARERELPATLIHKIVTDGQVIHG
ncbi:MAG: DNA polymerase III subunit beta [Halochromatium sp.]|nr:DNA polymerase III subunit beta [Halochromatium sp.]